MHRLIAAVFAALPLVITAQGTPHTPPPAPAVATPERTGGVPERAAAAPIPIPTYRSPFADYRPFSEEVAPKAWRAANDEVRETGGHIGLMKGLPAQMQGHGAHGAKQPVPPADPK
jgi:hypothetical protein